MHTDGSVNMLKLGDNTLILRDHPLTPGQAEPNAPPRRGVCLREEEESGSMGVKGDFHLPDVQHAHQYNC